MLNGIVSHQDMAADASRRRGRSGHQRKLLDGHKVGDKTYKVHIDGFNMLPYLTGEVKESPRQSLLLHQR